MTFYPHKTEEWSGYGRGFSYILSKPKDQLELFRLSGNEVYTWKEGWIND